MLQRPTNQPRPTIKSVTQGFGANSVDILLKTAMISGLLAYLVMFIWSFVTSTIACSRVDPQCARSALYTAATPYQRTEGHCSPLVLLAC